MTRVPLILLGAGKVGRALVAQLIEAAPFHAERDGIEFSIVGWCDLDGAAVVAGGLSAAELRAIAAAKAAGASFPDAGHAHPAGAEAMMDAAGSPGCIVADLTASDGTAPALELALDRGYGAATANKMPLVGPQAGFDRLTRHRSFRYETTVGSAVPVIEATLGLMRAADRVDVVRGVFSGTLGFITTGLQAGRSFSSLVHEAVRRGYAEPDVRLDLGGMDVARKALILARTLGWRLELGEVQLTGLLPAEFAGIALDDCLARLQELDQDYASRAAQAAADGRTLRFVAELREGTATIGLQAVPADSPVGQLRGSDNLVAFHTRCYADTPLVLQGRGAGVDAAAAGVHADIVALAKGR